MSACCNHEATVRPARSTRAPIAAAPFARIFLTAAALILTAISAPGALATGAGSHGALPGCPEIPNRIARHPWVLSAIAEIVPATGTLPAYCEVVITQRPAINIRIGLPLSTIDGGAGGVQGDWTGRVQNLGGGGFGGTLGPVGEPAAAGYVASITDTGHSAAWCNAINPRTGLPSNQPNCGLAGGGKICKYPDEAVYDGSGDPMDHNSYHCAINETEPQDLAADSDLARISHRFRGLSLALCPHNEFSSLGSGILLRPNESIPGLVGNTLRLSTRSENPLCE
jgi:feruloyl esterase